jgi:hypothetical protein
VIFGDFWYNPVCRNQGAPLTLISAFKKILCDVVTISMVLPLWQLMHRGMLQMAQHCEVPISWKNL